MAGVKLPRGAVLEVPSKSGGHDYYQKNEDHYQQLDPPSRLISRFLELHRNSLLNKAVRQTEDSSGAKGTTFCDPSPSRYFQESIKPLQPIRP
jgi:hypothetical protein